MSSKSNEQVSIDRLIQLRNDLIDEIHKDIVGPREENELVPTSPTKKYLSGVLYPQNNIDSEHVPEKKIRSCK